MKLTNKHKKVELLIENELVEKFKNLGIANFPKECGGFLIGYYSDDYLTLNITGSILPKKQVKSFFLFERSIKGLQEVFYKLFETTKHYYVGEWHTHPNGSSHYSQTDLNAMIKIANCSTVNIENPVLLILSIKENKMQGFSVFLYDKKGLYQYE
jgi:[CysO sulfur-carrier protein]-S-L-cysteine hydrolase